MKWRAANRSGEGGVSNKSFLYYTNETTSVYTIFFGIIYHNYEMR
jgi:hypothetical protein